MNPYRAEIVKGYRERLLKALVRDDLFALFREIAVDFPRDVVEARYYLITNWTPQICELALEKITRNLEIEQ